MPFFPRHGVPITADSGWTANSTAGDKTAVVAAYTNGLDGTMISALNVVSPGLGTALNGGLVALEPVVKKVAALQTVLVASKIPNT